MAEQNSTLYQSLHSRKGYPKTSSFCFFTYHPNNSRKATFHITLPLVKPTAIFQASNNFQNSLGKTSGNQTTQRPISEGLRLTGNLAIHDLLIWLHQGTQGTHLQLLSSDSDKSFYLCTCEEIQSTGFESEEAYEKRLVSFFSFLGQVGIKESNKAGALVIRRQ